MEGVAMKATRTWAAALTSALLAVPTASAQYSPVTGQYHSPVMRTPLGYAPDMRGPGFFIWCPNGQTIGPNYCVRPCFEPFNGVRPCVYPIGKEFVVTPAPPTFQPQPRPQEGYPYHPYARSPRDFFMFREMLEEQAGRQARPNIVP
jgi:hypothetical protein